jgi:hypothetical protein
MAGDFDFDADGPKGKRPYSAARRVARPGGASISVGALIVGLGGVVGVVAAFLPAAVIAEGYIRPGADLNDLLMRRQKGISGLVAAWGVGAIVVGLLYCLIQPVKKPTAVDYLWLVVGVVLGLTWAVLFYLSTRKLAEDIDLHNLVSRGSGLTATYVACGLTLLGTLVGCAERIRKLSSSGQTKPRGYRSEDDEDERPRRRRRSEEEDDEDRPPRRTDNEGDAADRPRRRRRSEEEDDEDDRPRRRH